MNVDKLIETWLGAKAEGWCDEATARRLIGIIAEARPKVAVEIGVFGGSSLIPQALALREVGSGIIYGIDPWSRDDAMDGMLSKENIDYWASIDWGNIYQGLKDRIEALSLERQVVLLRDTSAKAANRFTNVSIGLLHIDGNHSEEHSLLDATLYLPKVAEGGFIYFADIGWYEGGSFTTKAALNYLLSNGCAIVEELKNEVVLKKGYECPH